VDILLVFVIYLLLRDQYFLKRSEDTANTLHAESITAYINRTPPANVSEGSI